MSTASKNHWRDNQSQYNYSQYVFYLILLGLVLAALIVFIIWFMRPPKVAESKMIIWISKQGGERPIIPFQESDVEVLKSRLEYTNEIYDFDDQPQFEPNAEKMLADHIELGNEDTTFVMVSGVGVVVDEKPCLMTAAKGQHIELNRILETLLKLQSDRIIVLLDCGHQPSDRSVYQSNSQRSNDANEFVDYVRNLEFTDAMNKKLALIISSDRGQRPLYSTTRRRSLFGIALEKTLENENDYQSVEEFVEILDANLLTHGGNTAPKCVLIKGQEFSEGILPALSVLEAEPEERRKDAAYFSATKETLSLYARIDKTWEDYIGRWARSKFVAPVTLNGPVWQSLTDDMVRMSHLQLTQTPLNLDALSTRIDNFDQLPETTKSLKKLKGMIGELSETSTATPDAELFEAIDEFYSIEFRLKFYTAVYDDLSWVLPGNGRLQRFRNNIAATSETLSRGERLSRLTTMKPELDNLAVYKGILADLKTNEKELVRDLRGLALDSVDSLNGMEKEVAVDILLRFPFWTPYEDSSQEQTTAPDQLPTRKEIRDRHLANDFYDGTKRTEKRGEEAERRVQLYRLLQAQQEWQNSNRSEANRQLQAYAYHLSTQLLNNFGELEIQAKTIRGRVIIRNKSDWVTDAGIIIEQGDSQAGGNSIQLDVDVQGNPNLRTQTELVSDDFAFDDGSEQQLDSPGTRTKFRVWAKRNNENGESTGWLKVKIFDPKNETIQDSVAIKLRLPQPNRLLLKTKPGMDHFERAVTWNNGDVDVLRPFANNDETWGFSLENQWHKKRDLIVTLYQCSVDSRAIKGKITEKVKQLSLNQLQTDDLPIVAQTSLQVNATETKNVDWNAALPENITPPAPLKGINPIDNGLLCEVRDLTHNLTYRYWLEIFPETQPAIELTSNIRNNDLYFVFKRTAYAPDKDIEISWRFGDITDVDDIPNAVILEKGETEIALDDQVLEDINQQLEIGDLVYFTVDNWPEKIIRQYNGEGAGRLEEPKTTDLMRAELDVRMEGVAKNAEERKLKTLTPEGRFQKVLATQEKATHLWVDARFNVPTSIGMFSFSNFAPDQNSIRLRVPPQLDRVLYYPWALKPQIQIKKGLVKIKESVSFYEFKLPAGKTKFTIWPEMTIGGSEAQGDSIAGTNRMVTYFDRTPPRIENVQVLTTDLLEAGDLVELKLDVADNKGGVGLTDDKEVMIFFSKTDQQFPGQLPSKGGVLAKPSAEQIYRAPAPALPENQKRGRVYIGIRVTDKVGNTNDSFDEDNFVRLVAEKQSGPPKNKDGQKKPTEKKKILNHQVVVSVTNVYGSKFSSPPEVTLEPKLKLKGGYPKRVNDSTYEYVFEFAKESTTYNITSSYKDKDGELEGSAKAASFSKNYIQPIKRKRTIRMRRK